jgi:predicted acyl esterase
MRCVGNLPYFTSLAVTALFVFASAVSAPASPPAVPPANLTQYVGQYRNPATPDRVHAIYVDAGSLYVESEQREPQKLLPDSSAGSPDKFRLLTPPAHLLFLRDRSGAVTGLQVVLDSGQSLPREERFSTIPAKLNHTRPYTRQEVMIPMRDGVQLHAVILRPAQTSAGETLPFLMDRTPYGVDDDDSIAINQSEPELAASGYIFVFEDIRGRYGSGGTFVMNRPIVEHTGPTAVDETTDTRDTIDWLLKNIPGNNGRVGVFGVSYDGFLAMMAGIDPHPAVKAISPQAPMTDVWLGDDFFHNGAFRETYGFDYVQQMEAQKTDSIVNAKEDTYEFFLKHINFAGAAEAAHMSDLPTARAFLTQPSYTKFWRDMAVESHLDNVSVPTLEVGGFWDQEDMWGTQEEYAVLKQHDPRHQLFLVLGPWNHGEWEGAARTLQSPFGGLDFGEPTGIEFRKTMEFPFFEKYLKDRPGFDLDDRRQSLGTLPHLAARIRFRAGPPLPVPRQESQLHSTLSRGPSVHRRSLSLRPR